MALMEWSPSLSVNVKKFDDQHKKLVEMVNQLHDAMKAGQGNAMLGIVLQSLISYTGSHFADEEKMLQLNGYPDLAKHKTLHDNMVKQVLEMQKQFQSGGASLTLNVMTFLKNWLVNHIQGDDKKYGAYLNSKGIF